ncbi:DNA helicase [Armatimonadetes bacterium Uphvl-Ar1]|nr:DNA helicase [Armatimonadetes bacterium Uphvl-Ar1]
MEFRIADSFTTSLSKLTAEDQKLSKTTAFDLQMNPANPGHQFHKLDRAKDSSFWSVRVGRDIRLIVHRSESSLLLCYVDHHDDAYRWAERRKLETHPRTGAAQIVEIREIVREVEIQQFVLPDEAVAAPADQRPRSEQQLLFAKVTDEELLSYGVPVEWLSEVRVATENSLFDLADHLPAEAGEALLELATGGKPVVPLVADIGTDPFAHPDALRRFRTVENAEELAEALDYPLEKWAVFLHPAQRELVERDYSGAARVAGTAGTGKTVVAIHRAVFLAKHNPDSQTLLTTISPILAKLLQTKVRRLLASEPRVGERIEVADLDSVVARLFKRISGSGEIIDQDSLLELIRKESENANDHKFSVKFLSTEWLEIVDAWQIKSWEEYRDVKRLGRKTRLPEPLRKVAWSIFERVSSALAERNLVTLAGAYAAVATTMESRAHPLFDFIVVDECQDLSIPQLRFLASTGADRSNRLFFAGDSGQRIFQYPFSWLAHCVDIRGRSRSLRINYRTSHQIRNQADLLLGKSITDVDGFVEERQGTFSVFNGPNPDFYVASSVEDEIDYVAKWIRSQLDEVRAQDICIMVRTQSEIERAREVCDQLEIACEQLDGRTEPKANSISVCTMHNAKGLEFRSVVVMCVNDDVLPLQSRIQQVSDESDLDEVYNTERHLLYVACTRAREHLLVTSSGEPSEFLSDLTQN